MIILLNDAAPHIFVEAIVNSLWQGTALALLIWLLLRLCGQSNATTRYSVWLAALLAVVCLPFLNALNSSRTVATANLSSSGNRLEQFSMPSSIAPPESLAPPVAIPADALKHESRFESVETAPIQLEAQGISNSRVAATPLEARTPQESLSIRLSGEEWPRLILILWMLGVVLMTSRLTRCYMSLRRLKRASRPLAEHYQQRMEHWLKACAINRKVSLRASKECTVPLMMGLRTTVILLPERLADELSADEFDQVLLHELAHTRRRDDWTNLLQKSVEALFFFHPVVLWIGRQLNAEREIACDQWVVSVTGAKRSYASCLAKLFELTRTPRTPLLAPGAMKVKSHLSRRIETILKSKRNSSTHLSIVRLLIPLFLLCGMLIQFGRVPPVIAVSVRANPEAQAPEQEVTDGATGREQSQPGGTGIDVRLADLSRAIDAGTGDPSHNNTDDEARQQVSQETYAARNFGLSGSQREMPTQPFGIEPAQAAANISPAITLPVAYMSQTGNQPEVSNGTQEPATRVPPTAQSMSASSARVSSSGVEIPADFFKAVAASDSPASQRELLTTLLKTGELSREMLVQIFNVAKNIESDGEKAEFLSRAAGVCTGDTAVLNAFLNAASSINSAGEKRRVLFALLKLKGQDKGILSRVLRAAASIDSDGEKAELLLSAASLYAIDDAAISAFLNTASSIDSAAERRRALTALLRRGGLSNEVFIQIVRFARSISSDGEKAEFLIRFAEVCPVNEAVVSAFMATASSIHSVAEQQRALAAIYRKKGPARES
jgi:beta-lactamase regulating signal transducer with metallopeptidase domain